MATSTGPFVLGTPMAAVYPERLRAADTSRPCAWPDDQAAIAQARQDPETTRCEGRHGAAPRSIAPIA
ncbi:MAG: hypothetical protein GXY34_15335 [Syntrophomonadaceae bacterium]|nr:hypothetical protein [Syntrophomonadaceae bacterium]